MGRGQHELSGYPVHGLRQDIVFDAPSLADQRDVGGVWTGFRLEPAILESLPQTRNQLQKGLGHGARPAPEDTGLFPVSHLIDTHLKIIATYPRSNRLYARHLPITHLPEENQCDMPVQGMAESPVMRRQPACDLLQSLPSGLIRP